MWLFIKILLKEWALRPIRTMFAFVLLAFIFMIIWSALFPTPYDPATDPACRRQVTAQERANCATSRYFHQQG